MEESKYGEGVVESARRFIQTRVYKRYSTLLHSKAGSLGYGKQATSRQTEAGHLRYDRLVSDAFEILKASDVPH